MAKQDKSKFQLNKGTDHGFDISKGGKRKFDLSKDDDEPVVASVAQPQPTDSVNSVNTTPKPAKKKNGKWLWVILAIIVIILLIWWLFPGKSTESAPIVEEETIEEVTTPAENTEDVSNEAEISAGEDAGEENANNDESSNPSEAVVNTQETTPAAPQTTNNVATNNAPSVVSNDVEAEAIKVIRGEYGIGQERKVKLGNYYEAIQRRVNELKREGAF
ncbi:hypothetical protein [Barnesiella sp. CU968]|mgnify:FL=1|jgi:cytoskeletal protein RodZ|uniref:hypothetical protein n=1 Tax=Barnesiella sp. CU968 TaxID=2780099 RepID=UPI00195786F0|nr:hypothetical protein [Barnesiella sp. CU968]MCI9030747.1 hypothetical protein [Muribaculaceae bacterium]